jgi:transcriptional regulator with XRE-family HTH domain
LHVAQAPMPTTSERQANNSVTDADWTRRAELADLLRASRARLGRPATPGTRSRGLRQEDVASLAGLSLRRYAAFERGEFAASPGMIDQIAVALQMPDAERSALHVLAAEQNPPRPVSRPTQGTPTRPSGALRELVSHLDPYPAALTDETWTVLHHDEALDAWSGGWYTAADAADRHLIAYLFSENAEAFLPDVHALRRPASRGCAISTPATSRRGSAASSTGSRPEALRRPICGHGMKSRSPRTSTRSGCGPIAG